MNDGVIERTIMPEDPAQPEAEPEPGEISKLLANKKVRPASTENGYKR